MSLYSFLTGPIRHERLKCKNFVEKYQDEDFYLVREYSEDLIPRVSFSFRIREKRKVELFFSNIRIEDLKSSSSKNDKNSKYFIHISSISGLLSPKSSDVRKGRLDNLSWSSIKPKISYSTRVSLKKLMKDSIILRVYRKKFFRSGLIGEAVFILEEKIKRMSEFSSRKVFSLILKSPTNPHEEEEEEEKAKLEFNVEFWNIPQFEQLRNGVHSQYNFTGDPVIGELEAPEFDFHQHAGSIEISPKTFVTIDLGTSMTGYAYCTHDVKDIDKANIHMCWNEIGVTERCYKYKNKTCILYEEDKPIRWGFVAQYKYGSLIKNSQKSNINNESKYTLIEDIKTLIHLKTIEGKINGRVFLVEDVLSDFLGLVRKSIFEELSKQGYNTEPRHIKYTITVPSFWSDFEKYRIREACIKAKIILPRSEMDIYSRSSVWDGKVYADDDEHFDLSLESEVSAIPCLLYDRPDIEPKIRYLVVDVGGGTIDVGVYETVKPSDRTRFGIRQVQASEGEYGGGKDVDEMFLQFVESILPSPEVFQRLTKTKDFWLFLSNWEDVKKYDPENHEEIRICLPRHVNDIFFGGVDERFYEKDDGELVIPSSLLIEFMRPTIDQILDLVETEMNRFVKPVSIIFMVGGFTESRFYVSEMRRKFERRGSHEQEESQKNMMLPKIISTGQPGIRILQGAIWLSKYPRIVASRYCRWTYIAKLRKNDKKKKGGVVFLEKGVETQKKYRIFARVGDIFDWDDKYRMEFGMNNLSNFMLDIFVSESPRIQKIEQSSECKLLVTLEIEIQRKSKLITMSRQSSKKKWKNVPPDKIEKLYLYVELGKPLLRFVLVDPMTGKRINHVRIVLNDNYVVDRRRRRKRYLGYDPDLRERSFFLSSMCSVPEIRESFMIVTLKIGGSFECFFFKSFLL